MATVDPLLVETIEALLADHCAPEQVGAAEGGLDAKLWGALSESGLAGRRRRRGGRRAPAARCTTPPPSPRRPAASPRRSR